MFRIFFYLFCSAILLALSSKVFGFWIFSFLALVPYFHALNIQKKTSFINTFISGLFFGSFYSGILLFGELFNYKLPFFITSLVCGLFFGLMNVVYIKIKRGDIYDVFIFSSIWVLFEWLRQLTFQYFDYTNIAYTSYGDFSFISFASIGGIYLVSFLIVLTNSFIAYFNISNFDQKAIKTFFVCCILFVSIYYLNNFYLNFRNGGGHEVTFSTIQVKKDFAPYVILENKFIKIRPEIENFLHEAVLKNTDYIIYPYSPVLKAVTDIKNPINQGYIGTDFIHLSNMISKNITNKSKFIFWLDVMREGTDEKIFDEVNFWSNGTFIDYYQKRHIHPFYDISSDYFRKAGIINQPYRFTPSKEDKIINIGEERFGALNCSELNYSYLARRDSTLGSNIILSVVYSYVFKNFDLGRVNVVLAKFRAAETNLPVIKVDIRGPSVFIDKKGIVVSSMEEDTEGVLVGKLFVEDRPQKTIYTIFGDYPLIISIFIFLFYIYHRKSR